MAYAWKHTWFEVGGDRTEQPTSGIQITNEGLVEALKLGNMFTKEEFDPLKVSNLSYDSYIKVDDKYFKPARPITESPFTEVDGGVVIAIRTPAGASNHSSASASQIVIKQIAQFLTSKKMKVDDSIQFFDIDKDDKLSLSDLQEAAKRHDILNDVDIQALFSELKEEDAPILVLTLGLMPSVRQCLDLANQTMSEKNKPCARKGVILPYSPQIAHSASFWIAGGISCPSQSIPRLLVHSTFWLTAANFTLLRFSRVAQLVAGCT